MTVESNLACLLKILEFNLKCQLMFFRITSDLIPFASHPICGVPWQKIFEREFKEIGDFIKKHKMRVSMHPDQFVLINSPNEEIFQLSVRELLYHAEVLDLLGVDTKAKIQIHVGGVYGNKKKSIRRFLDRYGLLPDEIKRRLVIENDERLYSVKECLVIYRKTKIPVVFDVLHFRCNNDGESIKEAFSMTYSTWSKKDGVPIVDYSSQENKKRIGTHAKSINLNDFREFIRETGGFDFDIMFEIKDKERSAIKAASVLEKLTST